MQHKNKDEIKKLISFHWIKLYEALPNKREPVLFCSKGKVYLGNMSCKFEGGWLWVADSNQFKDNEIDAWMPLPIALHKAVNSLNLLTISQ